jgi:hypothetical protein
MNKFHFPISVLIITILVLSACQTSSEEPSLITVTVVSDGRALVMNLPSGSTVQTAVEAAALSLGQLDRISPPIYSNLIEGTEIVITRVQEEYETEQQEIPYERQELPNESMAAGESLLIQVGKNGLSEITIRHLYEDGIEESESVVSESIIISPVPEILMVGVQNPFASVAIHGKLVYLTGGNAWVMEDSTANRHPLITSGDLDGRIFTLSPDGRWLLFSRLSNRPPDQEINSLWVVNISNNIPQPINLHVANVVHFADWKPGESYTIAYSTVEPRSSAPGWQANNDLYLLSFDSEKSLAGTPSKVLDSSSGGIYGWWGTTYTWSQDGKHLAYSRPDEIGFVDVENKTLNPIIKITPYNTYSDWAWIPNIAWGSDNNTLFFVSHALPTGLVSPEDSPFFDLEAISLTTGSITTLIPKVGMFSYPLVSPVHDFGGETAYEIAYLQAIFPSQSATSHYRLIVMDRDGSERQTIFPAETQTGFKPQIHWGAWAPESANGLLAFIYMGNLWIIDTLSGHSQQVTGDGLTNQVDWE